jgi:hypothetical protein
MPKLKHFTNRIKSWLSHHASLYALFGGIGVILFWRGVWHTMDYLMLLANTTDALNTIDLSTSLWWDGPLSIVIGTIILLTVSAFVSSLIGNELILDGLRTEQRQLSKTGGVIHNESQDIDDLRKSFSHITKKLDHLDQES